MGVRVCGWVVGKKGLSTGLISPGFFVSVGKKVCQEGKPEEGLICKECVIPEADLCEYTFSFLVTVERELSWDEQVEK